MELNELTHDQRLALVSLIEAVSLSNGIVTDGERGSIAHTATLLGDDEYRALLEEADRRFSGIDGLKAFLPQIASPEARNLIYGTVWEAMVADPDIDHRETELLNWLAETWSIKSEPSEE